MTDSPRPPVGNLALILRPRPACHAALVIINGRISGDASFALEDGRIIVTPHADGCR